MKQLNRFGITVLSSVFVLALIMIPLGASVVAAEDSKLGALWAELSEDDRSAIKTASGQVGSIMQTIKGTANAKFWSELDNRGLLRSVTLVEIFGAQAEVFEKAGMVAFAMTPKGAESIPGLVKDLEKN